MLLLFFCQVLYNLYVKISQKQKYRLHTIALIGPQTHLVVTEPLEVMTFFL